MLYLKLFLSPNRAALKVNAYSFALNHIFFISFLELLLSHTCHINCPSILLCLPTPPHPPHTILEKYSEISLSSIA